MKYESNLLIIKGSGHYLLVNQVKMGRGPKRELWSLLGIAFRDRVYHGVAGSVTFLHDSKGILVSFIV